VKNILIPIEKNSEKNTAIAEAVEIAKKFNSKITLLNVDNTRKILAEINNNRLIDDGRMLNPFGNYGLVDENTLAGASQKQNIKENTKKYSKKNLEDRYIKGEKYNYINFIKTVAKFYKQEDIETDTIIAEGDPASAILDEVEEGNYDLVIMKTHTMKEKKRFMLGSVTNKVVHHISIPIMIIR